MDVIEIEKNCPFRVGESVPIVKYKIPYVNYLKNLPITIFNRQITDILFIHNLKEDETNFGFEIGKKGKYYNLIPCDKRDKYGNQGFCMKKIKIPLRKQFYKFYVKNNIIDKSVFEKWSYK